MAITNFSKQNIKEFSSDILTFVFMSTLIFPPVTKFLFPSNNNNMDLFKMGPKVVPWGFMAIEG